jgi:hypothetical protein
LPPPRPWPGGLLGGLPGRFPLPIGIFDGRVLGEICISLAVDKTIKRSGFGAFVGRSKGERVGRNPKTGVEVPILQRRVMGEAVDGEDYAVSRPSSAGAVPSAEVQHAGEARVPNFTASVTL